jgi:hypothetical protein
MVISYTNSAGSSLVLNSGNYLISTHDLRNFTWDYLATNRPNGYGGRVTFKRPVQEKRISIGIRGASAAAFEANAATLLALTEVDILSGNPGKLYLGSQYLTCYLSTASAVNYHSRRGNWVSKELTIVVTEPFWHTEVTQRFLLGAPATVDDPKRYTGRYPYRYIASTSSGIVVNPHYAPAPMIITVYDAAEDPSITIGGKVYEVDATISAGSRIIINQLARTVVSMTSVGAVTNLFDYRDKTNDIFAYIKPGSNTVIYTGDFTFDITIIQQRSEPTWV